MTPKQTSRIILIAISSMFCYAGVAYANPLLENRYVAEVKRDAKGQILRRADVIAAFKKQHPCPYNGKTTGACKGWALNHVIPLACGGADSVSNMQWLPVVIKSGWQDWQIDRFERKIYKSRTPIIGVLDCKKELVIITDKINSN